MSVHLAWCDTHQKLQPIPCPACQGGQLRTVEEILTIDVPLDRLKWSD